MGVLAGAARRAVADTLMESRHLSGPAILLARIVGAREETGASWRFYTLQILDAAGNPHPAYPEIPEVASKIGFQVGDAVAIACPYGELNPVLLCEALL